MKFKLQLKPEQRNSVAYLLNHDYVLSILFTGYGKSLIFQLFAVAAMIERKEPQTVLVVCPLKSIIEDQIAEAKSMGIPGASSLEVSCCHIEVLPPFSLMCEHPQKHFQNFHQPCMLSTDQIEILQSQPASMT